MPSTKSWKRTLYAIWAAELLAIAGFSTSTPIIPLYLQDMGVSDPTRLKLLTGLMQALPSVALVFSSPIWGSVADNYGRKPMLLRAMFGGTIVMFLQGIVQAPWQLLLLRVAQGCITGTVAAATILVASMAPKEEAGYGLGLLQMAIFLGALAGPLIGGVIADLVGRRVNFFVTSALLLAAGIVVSRFAEDNFTPPQNRKSTLRSMVPDLTPLASSRALVSLIAVIAADQIAGSITNPFLPLIIQKLSPGSALIGSTTGLVLGCGAISSALAAFAIGKVSYRFGYKRTLTVCMIGAAVFLIPQAFARTWFQLLLLRIASGFFVGGNLPSANALIAQQAVKGKQGSIYGLSSSVASASNSVGPVIGAGIAMGIGFNAVFIATAAILASAGGAIMAFIRPQRASG